MLSASLQMDERDETQRGAMTWVISPVRAKFELRPPGLQVCGPSTALQLLPELPFLGHAGKTSQLPAI